MKHLWKDHYSVNKSQTSSMLKDTQCSTTTVNAASPHVPGFGLGLTFSASSPLIVTVTMCAVQFDKPGSMHTAGERGSRSPFPALVRCHSSLNCLEEESACDSLTWKSHKRTSFSYLLSTHAAARLQSTRVITTHFPPSSWGKFAKSEGLEVKSFHHINKVLY